MNRAGVLLAAFAFGAAVGFLNNVISGWAWRFGAAKGTKAPGEGSKAAPGWPAIFAMQYVLRIGLSLVSLYVTYRVSAGDAVTILLNLAGLLLARYVLLWRLSRAGS